MTRVCRSAPFSQVPEKAEQIQLPEVPASSTPTKLTPEERPFSPTRPAAAEDTVPSPTSTLPTTEEKSLSSTPAMPVNDERRSSSLTSAKPLGEEPVSSSPSAPATGEDSLSVADTDKSVEKKDDSSYQYDDDEFEEEEEEEATSGGRKEGTQESQPRQASGGEAETESTSGTAPKEQGSLSSSSFDQHASSTAGSVTEGQERPSGVEKEVGDASESTKRRSSSSSSAPVSRRSSKSSSVNGSTDRRKSSAESAGSHGGQQTRDKATSSSPSQSSMSASEAHTAETVAVTGHTSISEDQTDTTTESHVSDSTLQVVATKERDQEDGSAGQAEITAGDQDTATADATVPTESISKDSASQEESSSMLPPIQAEALGTKENQEEDARREIGEEVKGKDAEIKGDGDTSTPPESIANSTTTPEPASEELATKSEAGSHERQEDGGEQKVNDSPKAATSRQDTSDSLTAPSHADPSVGTEMTPDVQREKATEDAHSAHEPATSENRESSPTEKSSTATDGPDQSSSGQDSAKSSRRSSRTSVRAKEEDIGGSHGNSRKSSTALVKEPREAVSHPSTPAHKDISSRRSSKSSTQEASSTKSDSPPHHSTSRRSSKSSSSVGGVDRPRSSHSPSSAHSARAGSRKSSRDSLSEEPDNRSRSGSRKTSQTSIKDRTASGSVQDISGSEQQSSRKNSQSDSAQLKGGNSEGSTSAVTDVASKPTVTQDALSGLQDNNAKEAEQSDTSSPAEQSGAGSQEEQSGAGSQEDSRAEQSSTGSQEKQSGTGSQEDSRAEQSSAGSQEETRSTSSQVKFGSDVAGSPENEHQMNQQESEGGNAIDNHSSSDPVPLETEGAASLAEGSPQQAPIAPQVVDNGQNPSPVVGEGADPVAKRPMSASSTRSTTSENTYVSNVVGQALEKAATSLGQGSPVPDTNSFTPEGKGPSADVEKLETTPGLNQAESEVSLPMAADDSGDATKPTSPASGRQSRLSDRGRNEEDGLHDASDLVPPPTDSDTDKHPEERSKDRQEEHGHKEDCDPPRQEHRPTDDKTEHRPSLVEHSPPDHSDTSTWERSAPSEGLQHRDDLQPESAAQSEKAGEGPAQEEATKPTDEPSSYKEPDSELYQDTPTADQDGCHPGEAHLKEEQEPGEDQGKTDPAAESSTAGVEQSQHAPQAVPQKDSLAEEDKEGGSATSAGELLTEPVKNEAGSSRDPPSQDIEQEKTEEKAKSSETNIQTPLKIAPEDDNQATKAQRSSIDQLHVVKHSSAQRHLSWGSNTPKPVKRSSGATLRSTLTQGELNQSIPPPPPTIRRVHSI